MKYRGILFLDIDGTFLRWSLFLYLVEALIEKGILPAELKKSYEKEEIAWRQRQGSYDEYLMAVVRTFENNLPSVRVDQMEQCARQVVAVHQDEVYVYTRELIQEKLKDRWYVVAISSSQKETVAPFALHWGIHEVFATEFETRHGVYTGQRFLLTDKAGIVKNVLRRKEFQNFSANRIVGVGDSEGDIGMLQAVGRPICFNPSRGLYAKAKQCDWTVIVERKDVVYCIQL